MLPGLDTNVLVRWLIADDDEQVARVDGAVSYTHLTLPTSDLV